MNSVSLKKTNKELMSNLLVAENIVKKYGDYTALNNVTIKVPEASIFGLLGPNGAGKTSLIRIINQIIMPDSGSIIIDGKPLAPDDIQHIGYMPEERGLYKGMKVGEQALYLAQLKGMTRYDAKKKLSFWFDKLEIRDWWGKKVQELSKGMAQKVQFIVTVLHQPKLLIFDEPFSGFDPINANLIKDEILKLKDEGATVIFSTHRMESVEQLCEYIALFDKSNNILDGKLNDIKREFKTNTFEVEMYDIKNKFLLNELSENFDILSSSAGPRDNEASLQVKLKGAKDSNDLIQYLAMYGSIAKYSEMIPDAHEIFIKAIEKNAVNE